MNFTENHHETLDSLKYPEALSDLKNELSDKVLNNPERYPNKNTKESIIFDYLDKSGNKWQIVTRKIENTNKYTVTIKKLEFIEAIRGFGWSSKISKEDLSQSEITSVNAFNIALGSKMDKVIWKNNRSPQPKIGKIVYEMLNPHNESSNSKDNSKNNKPSENSQEENNTKKSVIEYDVWGIKWLNRNKTNWVYTYTVQKWDCKWAITAKLQEYTNNNINGITWWNFNSIPDTWLKIWLTIPLPNSDYKKSSSTFKDFQLKALEEMESDSKYWSDIKQLLKIYTKDHIAKVMTAYAWCESKLWEFSLFKYENSYKCASYWYHHILYKDTGLKAFKNLNMDISDSCDPISSWKLFLAFCKEKGWNQFNKFFDMEDTQWWAERYNWSNYKSNDYDTKLKSTYKSLW